MLLTTKCYQPNHPDKYLQRFRLLTHLSNAWEDEVFFFLISAPPGYGKSTLIIDWIQVSEISSCWLSIDPSDNHPNQFLEYITYTLRQHLSNPDLIIASINGPQSITPQAILVEIINQLMECKEPVLLVLDDYHNIENLLINQLVDFFLQHMPPKLRIAIITRADPPFNLAILRARRQMVEVRQKELGFTEEECQALFQNILRLQLSEENINTLMQRSEGWVVGLHLAGISINGQTDVDKFINHFSGSHRFIIEYLASEVLSTLPDHLKEFISRAAVLHQFSIDLLNHIFDISNSAELLFQIQSRNLFLIPLDENHAWFRFHHLIADLFKSTVSKEEAVMIQSKAAQWFNQYDMPREAIQLALDINDVQMACTFIRKSVILTAENGSLSTALYWLDAIPQEVLLHNSDLAIIRLWLLIYNGRFQHAFEAIHQLENHIDTNEREQSSPIVSLYRGIVAWSQTIFGQKMDLESLQNAYKNIDIHYPYFSPLILLALGQAQKESGLILEAKQSFEKGVALTEQSKNPVTNLILRNNLAFLLNTLGQRNEAIDICEEGMQRHSPNGKSNLLAGIPMLAYGCLLYQNGQLAESETTLIKSIHYIDRLGLTNILASPANQILQFLLSDQGRYEEAISINHDARNKAMKVGLTGTLYFLETIQAWIHLWHKKPELSQIWADQHPYEVIHAKDTGKLLSVLLHARLSASQGKFSQSIQMINEIEETATMNLRVTDWIQIKINQAIILHQAHNNDEAARILKQAIEKAEPISFHQAFVQEIDALAPILQQTAYPWPGWLIAFQKTSPIPSKSTEILICPPTEKEMEILRLVAGGMSNAEIADRLFITVGTTKWHLNHLFAKLGANRRTEAIVKAKEFGLI
jgi:LuxR family maltose regulon positive regulatory protein